MPGNVLNLINEGRYYAYTKSNVGILCSDKNLEKVEFIYFQDTSKYENFDPHNPLHRSLVINQADRR